MLPCRRPGRSLLHLVDLARHLVGVGADRGDGRGHGVGGKRGFVHGGGDHRHRLRLHFHRLADAVGRGLHLFHRLADRAVGLDRLAGRLLDGGDLGGDVVGGARRLVGERLHFLRDHREAAAGIARPRRLDGGVEREQIGLAGNVADEAQDRFDRFDMGRTAPG
jgi:hypothetical protein